METETLVLAGGVYNFVLAIGHLFLGKLLRWREQLALVTSLNRAVVQILNYSLTFAFLVFADLCWFHADEIVSTELGHRLLLLLSLFWYLRALQQIVFLGVRKAYSIVLTLVFVAGGTIFALALLQV